MTNNCLFCKIINKEIPATIIYENNEVIAILDINPVNPGHTLVIPKKHSVDILDTDDHLLGDIASVVKKVGQALKSSLGYEGFNVGVNNGTVAHQIIMHAHWHVIPRRENDGLVHWPHKGYAEGEESLVAEKLKSAIRNT